MTPSAALLAARELINNEPRASLHDTWIAQIAELLNIAHPVIEQSGDHLRECSRRRTVTNAHLRPVQETRGLPSLHSRLA